jgi:hypothetical protein
MLLVIVFSSALHPVVGLEMEKFAAVYIARQIDGGVDRQNKDSNFVIMKDLSFSQRWL